jgi:hypothetical protein
MILLCCREVVQFVYVGRATPMYRSRRRDSLRNCKETKYHF